MRPRPSLHVLHTLFFLILGLSIAQAAYLKKLPFPNDSFEEGLTGWTIPSGGGMTSVSSTKVKTGSKSLQVLDTCTSSGSNAKSGLIPISGGGQYLIRCQAYTVSGAGLVMTANAFDTNGSRIGQAAENALGSTNGNWKIFYVEIFAPIGASHLQIYLHSWDSAKIDAYLDDFEILLIKSLEMQPPWEGQFKINSATEANHLTAADVAGPDNIVYPNWKQCGVPGGIPTVADAIKIENHGGKANDDQDDAEALAKACITAGEAGGGAIVLGKGIYFLDRPITIRHNNVVIRGQGATKTRLVFRYTIPSSGISFFTTKANDKVGKDSTLYLHAKPEGLKRATLKVDSTIVAGWMAEPEDNRFDCAGSAAPLFDSLKPGTHVLSGVAEYKNGTIKRANIPITLDADYTAPPATSLLAAITIKGEGWDGKEIPLLEDARRGSTEIVLTKTTELKSGDCILIDAPNSPRWVALTRSARNTGAFRHYEAQISKVSGNTITLTQPLRIDFPVIDGAYVGKVTPIRRCGVENLGIQHTSNLIISSVFFQNAWECWAKDVTVLKTGRHPVFTSNAKWCEIRDCVFDDAWNKGDGGTAYAGWSQAWDCLMENVETRNLRHAPLFEFSASGNVIRKSTFLGSNADWHAGWTNENLIEQCRIETDSNNGGMDMGGWASPPEDAYHGPNGPRNVVYNCDIISKNTAIWLGGMNENYIIAWNRFDARLGNGVFLKDASFDHIIKNNIFILGEKKPMLFLATPDCVGVEIIDNTLYGGDGQVFGGTGQPTVNLRNTTFPLASAARPTPPIPSIYEWQKTEAK